MATTKVNPQQVTDYTLNSSLARQAIINGNFDVWQRGTSIATVGFLADHWLNSFNFGGGTLPTITITRQSLTSGELNNSFYFHRINANGAGSSIGASASHYTRQSIENGTRYLCGNGKKVTVSFWAKSDIANKKLGVFIRQKYGTGGSPTSEEIIYGTNWTLTSTWTKYTHTFTTNTLSGKTFGTANDDHILLEITSVWGSNIAVRVGAGTTPETYVGSGNIDIAQVQLCAGDVALPFMPKSYEEELRACQRYYETGFGNGYSIPNTDNGATSINYKVTKRASTLPIITFLADYFNSANIPSYVTGYSIEGIRHIKPSTPSTLPASFFIFSYTDDAEL